MLLDVVVVDALLRAVRVRAEVATARVEHRQQRVGGVLIRAWQRGASRVRAAGELIWAERNSQHPMTM